ncbi:GNAT family N-acetyltransferase [Stenotrophomonas sp. NPDC087984]
MRKLLRLDMNVGFARAVLDGKVEGQVWMSESVGDGAIHAVHPYGMSLVWGDRVDEAFDELIGRLRLGRYRSRHEWLQIDPRWTALPWEERLTRPEMPGQVRPTVGTRINFAFDSDRFRASHEGAIASGDWSIVRADASDFARPGSVVPAEFWRDASQFLEHGGGWRAEKNGTRGALAFTSFQFEDELELGIETAPEARGQGLATAVASSMIKDLLDHALTPVWACRADNLASHRLAEKLGFHPVRRLPYYGLAVPDHSA